MNPFQLQAPPSAALPDTETTYIWIDSVGWVRHQRPIRPRVPFDNELFSNIVPQNQQRPPSLQNTRPPASNCLIRHPFNIQHPRPPTPTRIELASMSLNPVIGNDSLPTQSHRPINVRHRRLSQEAIPSSSPPLPLPSSDSQWTINRKHRYAKDVLTLRYARKLIESGKRTGVGLGRETLDETFALIERKVEEDIKWVVEMFRERGEEVDDVEIVRWYRSGGMESLGERNRGRSDEDKTARSNEDMMMPCCVKPDSVEAPSGNVGGDESSLLSIITAPSDYSLSSLTGDAELSVMV